MEQQIDADLSQNYVTNEDLVNVLRRDLERLGVCVGGGAQPPLVCAAGGVLVGLRGCGCE